MGFELLLTSQVGFRRPWRKQLTWTNSHGGLLLTKFSWTINWRLANLAPFMTRSGLIREYDLTFGCVTFLSENGARGSLKSWSEFLQQVVATLQPVWLDRAQLHLRHILLAFGSRGTRKDWLGSKNGHRKGSQEASTRMVNSPMVSPFLKRIVGGLNILLRRDHYVSKPVQIGPAANRPNWRVIGKWKV